MAQILAVLDRLLYCNPLIRQNLLKRVLSSASNSNIGAGVPYEKTLKVRRYRARSGLLCCPVGLGLDLVDEHLSWKYHTCEFRKKLSRTIGLFFKLRHWISLPTLICLYNSLFSSFLNYVIIVWGLSFDTYLTSLFLLQKKILRCIKFQLPTTPSAPLFHSLKIVKLEDILHLNILTFVYKATNKLSSVYFHDYFTPDSSVHRFETRQATRGDLFISLKRTTLYGLKTVKYFGSKLWNTPPLFIRVATSSTALQSKLKAYIIGSYA